jgi:hypothetical protein
MVPRIDKIRPDLERRSRKPPAFESRKQPERDGRFAGTAVRAGDDKSFDFSDSF